MASGSGGLEISKWAADDSLDSTPPCPTAARRGRTHPGGGHEALGGQEDLALAVAEVAEVVKVAALDVLLQRRRRPSAQQHGEGRSREAGRRAGAPVARNSSPDDSAHTLSCRLRFSRSALLKICGRAAGGGRRRRSDNGRHHGVLQTQASRRYPDVERTSNSFIPRSCCTWAAVAAAAAGSSCPSAPWPCRTASIIAVIDTRWHRSRTEVAITQRAACNCATQQCYQFYQQYTAGSSNCV